MDPRTRNARETVRPGRRLSYGRRLAEHECDGVVVARIAYGPGESMPLHAHRRASLTLVLSGDLQDASTTTPPGAAIDLAALAVVYKPPGLVHATRVGRRAAASIQLTLPPEAAARMAATVLLVGGAELVPPLLGLARSLCGKPIPDEVERGVKRCLEGLESWAASAAPIERGRRDPLLERTSRSLLSGQTLRHVAKAVHAAPSTVWRCYRDGAGVSPTVWRRRARIARAAGLLAEPGAGIGTIALRCGFADHAHLCRAFRRETGLTPRQYRGVVGGNLPT